MAKETCKDLDMKVLSDGRGRKVAFEKRKMPKKYRGMKEQDIVAAEIEDFFFSAPESTEKPEDFVLGSWEAVLPYMESKNIDKYLE